MLVPLLAAVEFSAPTLSAALSLSIALSTAAQLTVLLLSAYEVHNTDTERLARDTFEKRAASCLRNECFVVVPDDGWQ